MQISIKQTVSQAQMLFQSATKQKTRASLAAGSYHVNSDGSDITGVTFPVKISDASVLEKYTQVTDESEVTITTNIKGKENTVTYKGQDALFESSKLFLLHIK